MSNKYLHSVYAYVDTEKGSILSYPVYPNHITARGQPVSLYTPVVPGIVVEEKPFHYVKEQLRYDKEKDVVTADQVNLPLPVQAILDELYKDVPEKEILMINQVPPEAISVVFSQVSEVAQKRLDAFANQKNYDNIVSLVGYYSSTISRFQEDAQKGVVARDGTWAPLIGLMEQIMTGQTGVPRKEENIMAVLPVLSWE